MVFPKNHFLVLLNKVITKKKKKSNKYNGDNSNNIKIEVVIDNIKITAM